MPDNEESAPHSLVVALAEYSLLKDLKVDAQHGGSTRMQLHLTVVGASIALLGYLNGGTVDSSVRGPLNVAIPIVLIALGLSAFVRQMAQRVIVVEYTRGLNRLRQYFVTEFPELADQFVLSTDDGFPPLGSIGSLHTRWLVFVNQPAIIALINSAVVSVAVIGVVDDESLQIGLSVLAGLASYALHCVAQLRYFSRAEKDWKKQHGAGIDEGKRE